MKNNHSEFGIFLWHNKVDGSKERLSYFTDNLKQAIVIAKDKSYLTKDKITIRKFNNNTEMYEIYMFI